MIASGGRVIEIGAVAIEDGRIVDELSTLIRTNAPISYGAFRVHGISPEMLRGKPTPMEVWPTFLEFIGNAPLIAHNAPFDMSFVRHELALLGDIPADCRLHRALDDARLAARVWMAMGKH